MLTAGGVLKDEVEAVGWYRKAAEQGNVSAIVYIGFAYDGRGMGLDRITPKPPSVSSGR